ncbi:MAG: M12 family metallopeptidase [Bdellovibrionales bacterium]|nr:M12 family metallopeptidase [Bdellovibrionales bacterium]
MSKLSLISSFRRLSLSVNLFFMAISGCGKFDVAHLNLSENGSRGTVLARFFQDQNIYEKELPFRNVDGYAFFEDDIILGRIDKLSVKPLNFVLPSSATGVLDFAEFSGIQSFAFAIEGGRLWTKGIVPYVITSAVSPAADSLKSAMQAITSNTGIKFVERTNETDYLEFVKSDQANTCGSYVGRQGGAQSVFVQAGAGGCGLAANVHELLHAIGLWHEQSRTDRDNHVEILYDNIIPEYKDQFDILPGVILGAYDFTSVMHYGVKFFSKNGNDTIRSRNGQKIERVVPMSGLDASGVKELYKSELSSGGGGGQCDPAAKGASCGITNGTGQMEDQTCNASTQQWVGGVCRVKTCNTGFQPDSARAACVQSGSNNEAPRGNVDGFIGDGVLYGWTYDPNSSGTNIDVHYYIDGAFAGASKADKPRSDVNTAFGIAGNHGFEFRVPDSYRNNQQHTIRAYGIDLQGQTNPELGAKTFTLGTGNIACNNANKGGSCNISNGTGQMEGQTCDGTTGNWVGGACRVKTCNTGFEPNSARTACVASQAQNEAPRGNVDVLTADGVLKGWSYDPNSSAANIDVHYYIDGAFAGSSRADRPRGDVNTAFGIAGDHGFEFRVPDSYRNNQQHTIRAYGIDLQGQTNPDLGSKSFTLGSGTPAVTGLSFVSGSYSVGVTGSASNLPDTTMWCLTPGSGSCTPNLSRMQDWAATGSTGNNRFNWKYEIRPYQVGWCPGTFTAVVQAPGETALRASFTIGYPDTSVSNGGLRVNNVPPPSVGVLKGCFEYYEEGGPNGKGTCGTPGVGKTAIINSGWSYNESDHSATFNGNSSVFGGRHGTIFFTFEYNCGLTQTVSGSF